jgi:hypothetical protein
MAIKVGDTCRVVVEWGDQEELKKFPVKVTGTQDNCGTTFFRVAWKSEELAAKYGVLFSQSELRKVKP